MNARQLPIYSYYNGDYFVDFRLEEMRHRDNPHVVIRFTWLTDKSVLADLRALRAEFSTPCYMASLDG